MIHDKLCRFSRKRAADDKYDDCEYCSLIAKVRADESKRKDNEIYEWRIKASDQYGHGFHEGWKRGHDAATHDVAAES